LLAEPKVVALNTVVLSTSVSVSPDTKYQPAKVYPVLVGLIKVTASPVVYVAGLPALHSR